MVHPSSPACTPDIPLLRVGKRFVLEATLDERPVRLLIAPGGDTVDVLTTLSDVPPAMVLHVDGANWPVAVRHADTLGPAPVPWNGHLGAGFFSRRGGFCLDPTVPAIGFGGHAPTTESTPLTMALRGQGARYPFAEINGSRWLLRLEEVRTALEDHAFERLRRPIWPGSWGEGDVGRSTRSRSASIGGLWGVVESVPDGFMTRQWGRLSGRDDAIGWVGAAWLRHFRVAVDYDRAHWTLNPLRPTPPMPLGYRVSLAWDDRHCPRVITADPPLRPGDRLIAVNGGGVCDLDRIAIEQALRQSDPIAEVSRDGVMYRLPLGRRNLGTQAPRERDTVPVPERP